MTGDGVLMIFYVGCTLIPHGGYNDMYENKLEKTTPKSFESDTWPSVWPRPSG